MTSLKEADCVAPKGAGSGDPRPHPTRLTEIHQHLLTHMKAPKAWESAVTIYYTSMPAPPVSPALSASTNPFVNQKPLADTDRLRKAAASFASSFPEALRLRSAATFWAWDNALRTRLAHIDNAYAVVTGVRQDSVLDGIMAGAYVSTLSPTLQTITSSALIAGEPASTLHRIARAHVIPDVAERRRNLRTQLDAITQGRESASACFANFVNILNQLQALESPLSDEDKCDRLRLLPRDTSVRMRLDSIYEVSATTPMLADWGTALATMTSCFLKYGGEAIHPAANSGAANRVQVDKPALPSSQRGCSYRHCANPARHRFMECHDFARAVAEGRETPRLEAYKYTGTTPVPNLPQRWRGTPGVAPVRATARAALSQPEPDEPVLIDLSSSE